MQHASATYRDDEMAWVSDEISLHRDIYLMVTLLSPGKIVIRQTLDGEEWLRVPLKRHKDTKEFCLRIRVSAPNFKIQVFTSTQPKEIKYDYI